MSVLIGFPMIIFDVLSAQIIQQPLFLPSHFDENITRHYLTDEDLLLSQQMGIII